MFQFEKYLKEAGIDVAWRPLLSNSYLAQLYASNSRSFVEVARCYARRLWDVAGAGKFDVIWLEKELWPFMPDFIDPAILPANIPYVVDFDDAVFHNYDQHANPCIRFALGQKIDSVMRRAHTVVAGNYYLAERAKRAGAERVVVLPSVVDKDVYAHAHAHRSKAANVTVGWIGSPASQSLLEPLFPLLAECLNEPGDRFVSVGARFDSPRLVVHELMAWSLLTESQLVATFDIGVMPVRDAPFERGKCGYKLIQYMAAGVPVIASPVGVNTEIVVHGETGFLAETPHEWRTALLNLKHDPELRQRMGSAGRRRVEQRYCTQVIAPQLAGILREAARASA